jgi:hypothetical protein
MGGGIQKVTGRLQQSLLNSKRGEGVFALDFFNHLGKVGDGVELLVNARKSNVSNRVNRCKFSHHPSADLPGGNFVFIFLIHIALNAFAEHSQGFYGNRSFAACDSHTVKDFLPGELFPGTVAFDSKDAGAFRSLKGVEPTTAGCTFTPTPNRLSVHAWA